MQDYVETAGKTLDIANDAKEFAGGLLDFFAPKMQNMLMDKKIDSAETAMKDIKSRLWEYGLQIDYKRYFEKQLKVPLMAVRELPEQTSDNNKILEYAECTEWQERLIIAKAKSIALIIVTSLGMAALCFCAFRLKDAGDIVPVLGSIVSGVLGFFAGRRKF